jgi:hypothetical protein
MIDLLCDLLAIACDWCARCVFVVTKTGTIHLFFKDRFFGGGLDFTLHSRTRIQRCVAKH